MSTEEVPSDTNVSTSNSSSMTEDSVKAAVLEVLATTDPAQVSFRQIKQRLLDEHHIVVDDKKEFILTVIEEFFAGDDEDEDEAEEAAAEDEEGEQDTNTNTRTTRNGGASSSSSSRRKSSGEDSEGRGTVLKKKNGGGFAQPVLLSYDLADFLGKRIVLRTEVTKLMWNYIKEHNLQNPEKKSEILCDEKMEKLFKRKKMQMFKMTKFLSAMMKSTKEVNASCLSSDEEEDNAAKKKSQNKRKRAAAEKEDEEETETEETKPKGKSKAVYKLVNGKSRKTTISEVKVEVKEEKPKKATKKAKEEAVDGEAVEPKKKGGGLSKACAVTPALLTLLSMDDGGHSRPQVVSKMWEYIRANNLQNPKDKREILLDQPLQDLFKVKKVTMFSMNKYLSAHVKNLDG